MGVGGRRGQVYNTGYEIDHVGNTISCAALLSLWC